MKTIKQIKEWCRQHIASSLLATALLGSFVSWGLSWIIPSPRVSVDNFPQKELTCTLNFGFPLALQVTKDEDFQILFKDKEVEEPWIYNITIENTGEQPILNEDFAKPLTIDFEESTSVIKATIIEASNRDLWDEFLGKSSIDGTVLSIEDILLNQGESITLNIFTEGAAGNINYNQRTIGLSNFILKNTVSENVEKIKKQMQIIFVIAIAVIIAGIALLVWLIIAMRSFHKTYLGFQKEILEHSQKYETLPVEEQDHEPEC